MRRPALAAALAVALLAPAAHGAPFASCLVVSDAQGDVAVEGAVGEVHAGKDGHADILAAHVGTDRATLSVRIDVADVSEFRQGQWRLSFTVRGRRAYVQMADGAWLVLGTPDPPNLSAAGLVGGAATTIHPTIDYGSSGIHVRVPYAAFAPAVPRPGDALTDFLVESREEVVAAGPYRTPAGSLGGYEVAFVDSAQSRTRHTVARRC